MNISSSEYVKDSETEKEHYSILYAYGVYWCAIGIVQLHMCSPFILNWHDAFQKGLKILEVRNY